MKTESEIREHLRSLEAALARRCDCRGTPNELRCYIGGQMIQAGIVELNWVLGDSRLDEAVAKFDRDVQEHEGN